MYFNKKYIFHNHWDTKFNGGENIRLNQKLILGLIIIFSLFLISSVSAEDVDLNDTLKNSKDCDIIKVSTENQSKLAGVFDVEVPDVPDLIFNETIYINSQNIDDYFVDGVLPVYHSNKTFIIADNFENLGNIFFLI